MINNKYEYQYYDCTVQLVQYFLEYSCQLYIVDFTRSLVSDVGISVTINFIVSYNLYNINI